MTKLRCTHCGIRFTPAPQVPKQTYCSKPGCQKERRRKWQKNKLKSDPDYRDNQLRAQKAWTDRNPDYWRQYRQNSSVYGTPPPGKQDVNAPGPRNPSVKMDSINPYCTLCKAFQNGVFRLTVLAEPDGVKIDAWIVELSSIHPVSSTISHRVKR
jgi:hypothetical protein